MIDLWCEKPEEFGGTTFWKVQDSLGSIESAIAASLSQGERVYRACDERGALARWAISGGKPWLIRLRKGVELDLEFLSEVLTEAGLVPRGLRKPSRQPSRN